MMQDELLIKATCRICCKNEKGSGFFISPNLILTARHVIVPSIVNEQEEIEVTNCNDDADVFKAVLVDNCAKCDIALLRIKDRHNHLDCLNVCCSQVVKEECLESYGYPDTFDGNLVGVPLGGKVLRVILDNDETIHDINLEILKPNRQINNKGFSGSPLVNSHGKVTAILRYENDSYLSAVSISKAKKFLLNNEIRLEEDSLKSFHQYNDNVFYGLPEDIKTDCEYTANFIYKEKSPDEILRTLKNKIFYPKSEEQLEDIIAKLKNNKQLDNCLWDGWIHLLTYVRILKGDYSEINKIQITLNNIELSSMFAKDSNLGSNGSLSFLLNFYFTEEQSYFQLARRNMREILTNKNNTCSIFNSNNSRFDLKKFTLKDKKKVLPDIGNPEGSGFSVNEKVHLGVLSLRQLSEEIAQSDSLEEASMNLENLFKDAIQ